MVSARSEDLVGEYLNGDELTTSLAVAPRRQQSGSYLMPLRDLRHIGSRGMRFLDNLPLLRRGPGFSLCLLRCSRSADIYFHHALQHTAYAARETYAIGSFKSMCPDRTVTIYRQKLPLERDRLR